MSELGDSQLESVAQPMLELRLASKAFGYVLALQEASLSAYAGEVIALVGDNGAGKSTMVKLLSGVHVMDSGELFLEGSPVTIRNPRDAQALGISTVFQDLALVEVLDVAANIYLGKPLKRGLLVDRSGMIEGAADLLRDLRIRIPSVRVPVGTLSGGQRQGVAIARSVLQKGRVIIMDEPTAALGVRETRHVEGIISELRASGRAVILISHDLELVFRMADRIEVLRLGRVQGVRRTTDTSREEILGLITGLLYEPGPVPSAPTPVAGPAA
ncbi:MAG: ATP-binding cassette domain-containing protein [Candidatus Limnocylindrales bacterium]